MTEDHFDVLIVGAGLSGIGAAYRLQTECPAESYAILEGRSASGGTWDLFRFPGVRSDSDMFTLGYPFRAWAHERAIADGSTILEYIRATASEFGIDKRIRYQHRVVRASWDSTRSRWAVGVEVGDGRQPVSYTCSFLYMCTGYYSYEGGYRPEFPGQDQFHGRIVHPQEWPDGLDYTGKRVVVHRERGDSGNARTGHGRARRSCDDGSEVPHLHPLPSRRRPDRPCSAAYRAGEDGRAGGPLEERPYEPGLLSVLPSAARWSQAHVTRRPGGSFPTAITSIPTSTPATTLGTSACASSRTGICSRPSRRERPR